MKLAIEVMSNSISEPREDGKVSPKVGAVLVKPDGTVETAYRGELRHGDHAEFTLLERKKRSENLEGSILFATLEPCAPGARRHPKLGCAERIVNARIKSVWVGIEDPDPDIDRKGIKYLQDNGIEVFMFDQDFQKQIKVSNEEFLKQAMNRSLEKKSHVQTVLSSFENYVEDSDTSVFSESAINLYLNKAKLDFKPYSEKFWNHLVSIGLVVKKGQKNKLYPTGYGIMLFADRPRDFFQQLGVKAKIKYGQSKYATIDFDGPGITIAYAIEEWLTKVLHSKISRESFERKSSTDFPIEPLREALINALAHRDYEQTGAKIYIDVDDDRIIVKSPGLPVDPITLDDLKRFNAPSLSRNPKITYVFNQMELMEESELGMQTFRTMQKEYGLPVPEYSFNPPYLTLLFPRSFASMKLITENPAIATLNTEELRGYDWIKSKGEITKKEYSDNFGYSDKKSERHLKKLVNLDIIILVGKGPSSKYKYK
jgi:ATP-dependent DNA helicase RecG